jgi:hypothetical protein
MQLMPRTWNLEATPHIKSLPTAATNRTDLLINSRFLNVILVFISAKWAYRLNIRNMKNNFFLCV